MTSMRQAIDDALLQMHEARAVISADEVYRPLLTRPLPGADHRRPLVVVGLNPSTATAEFDDQTIRKEKAFAKRWGCGRLIKVNAYDYRTVSPKVLKAAEKSGLLIESFYNTYAIVEAVLRARKFAGIVLVAWGQHITPEHQRDLDFHIGDGAMCLGTNQDGSPKHPLYLRYTTPLVPWRLP